MSKPSKCKNCEYAENVEFGGELLLYVKDKEIERLNNRINKAIEYINKMTEKEINEIEYNGEEFVVCGSDFGEGAYIIKSILEGDDKE